MAAPELKAAVVLALILAGSIAFKYALTPEAGLGPYSLVQIPAVNDSIARALATDPLKLLLPFEYEGRGMWLWGPAVMLPLYGLYQVLDPLGVYVAVSSLLVLTAFCTSWLALRSLAFSGLVALAFAFGTQFAYVTTMGFVLVLYLFLAYACVNLLFCIRLLQAPTPRAGPVAAFAATLVVLALALEWWLNYAAALMVGSAFLWLLARRHGLRQTATASAIVFAIVLIVAIIYLGVRLQVADEYLTAGHEEELIFTYHSGLLAIDDLIANFFTLTYMTIANYLPVFGSLSQTYLGDPTIVAEQNGYDQAMTRLVVMNHLFLWRFYAGALVALFCAWGGRCAHRAWRRMSVDDAVIAILFLAVLVGSATHLIIKYRPYMSAPALTYKPAVSLFFFTLLIGYVAMVLRHSVARAAAYRGMIAGLSLVIFIGALTRPAALNVMLQHVGLLPSADPLDVLLRLFP